MGKAKATTAVALSGLLVVAQTMPAWAGSAAPADPWLHLAIDRPAAGQKPARSYLAAMPSIAPRTQPILPEQAPAPDLSTPENGLSEDLKGAIACAAVGSVATVAAVAVGAENLTNLIAGGVVAPASPAVLYLGLVGVIFAAFCGIAENLMPIYLHATEPAPEPQVTPSKLPADGSERAAGPIVIPAASAQVSERLSAKFDQVAMWSGQTADGLGAQVSERLSAKFDQVAMWSGQIMKKLSVKADAVSVKAAEAALWSEQMIGRPAAGQKPARSYLAAMLSAVHRVKAYGPMPDPVDHLLAPDGNSMSLGVKQAIACLGVGTAATAGAIAVGAENLTNLIAGGLVTAANPAVLYLGLTGIVFASFCAIGSALTPIYLYYTLPTSPHPGPGQNMANPSG